MTGQTVSRKKEKLVSPGVAVFLAVVVLSVAWLEVADLTQNTFLHDRFGDFNWRLFGIATPAMLLLLLRGTRNDRRSRNLLRSRKLGLLRYAVAMLLGAVAFAGVLVLATNYGLLLAVRFGQAEPVELHSQVDSTWQGKGCRWGSFSFYNVPLHRPTGGCADRLGVGRLKVGEPIVVRELVGDWGATILSVKREGR